jgi:hypothetical protein
LRVSEQGVQAELQAKQRQIDALNASAMSARSGRQALVEKRRLEATERIWAAAVRVSSQAIVPRMLENFNLEEVLKTKGADSEKVTKLFKFLDDAFRVTVFIRTPGQTATMEERPFVSAGVWAYYSAYSAVILNALLLVSALSQDLERNYFKFDSIRDVVKQALPHHAANIDEHGITYCYMCASELLDNLLAAVQSDLEGKVRDANELRRFADIQKAVAQLNDENAKRMSDPKGELG